MLALLLAAALSYTLHAKDVFQPPPKPALESWRAPAINREAIQFQTTEGAPLRGWLYRADAPSAPCVLFFYGSNEDLAHESTRLAWLRDTFHVNAVAFDIPGYGYSGGSITIPAILSAALQQVDYVQAHIAAPSAPIIAYGWSIGAALAIHAARRKLSGLILQAPPATAAAMEKFSSKHDVPWYAHGVVSIKADPDVTQLYEGAAAIRTIPTPLLVLQGSLDDVVPIDQGRAIVAASPAGQKQFVEVPGAHHNDLHYKAPPASDAIAAFLANFSR